MEIFCNKKIIPENKLLDSISQSDIHYTMNIRDKERFDSLHEKWRYKFKTENEKRE